MLSDEEKKTIQIVEDIAFVRGIRQDVDGELEDLKAIEDVLRLVEKQSKEIEELNKSDTSKEQSSMKYYNLHKELVDKIKAKIEELQEDIKYSANPLSIDNSKFAIEVLQSLLEKE